MQGARRVITFCTLIAILPVILLIIPLYLRHSVYANVSFAVAESDILEIVNGISSVFCQEHSLSMNTTFNAFQIKGPIQRSHSNRKHVQLKKSMSLPDDTLEYWGFYLPSGSTVYLSVCSRYDGSRILVVKGEKNLRNCGLEKPAKMGSHIAEAVGNVIVKFKFAGKDNIPQAEGNEFEKEELFEGEVKEEIEKEEKMDFEKPVNNLLPFSPSPSNVNSHHHRHEVSRKRIISNHGRMKNKSEINNSRKKKLEMELSSPIGNKRLRRSPHYGEDHKLDGGGIAHGGTSLNYTQLSGQGNDSSLSSFETTLLTCYDGQILLAKSFLPSKQCTSPVYLETGEHMQAIHEVASDGYYYYIFYSDNDYIQNDIHAIFNIHKPTYQFLDYKAACLNVTECSFPISFMSDETVIVEVPTRDGIEDKPDDYSILLSKCHPRSTIYAIFPVTILFLILACAFV